MVATLIQRYDKKIISFQERETKLKFYRLSSATFYDCINTIYQFLNLSWIIKYLFFKNMEPLIKYCFRSVMHRVER